MTSDVVLSAAMRANLLSLQNTQSSVDITQNRLATGKKVNSALDNPASFFASRALTDRASDLTRLLDGIGQSIQVIKAADNGVTALTKLIEQADSIASQARDALAQGEAEAKATGEIDLRNIDSLTSLAGIANNDTLVFSLTDDEGNALNVGAYNTAAASATATATITINDLDSIDEFIAEINNLHLEGVSGSGIADGKKAFEASLDDNGHLQIKALDGNNFRVNFVSAAATDAGNLALAQELGFGDIARLVADDTGAANNNVEFSAIASATLKSFALYDNSVAPRELATRGDLITNLRTETGTVNLFQNIDANTDDYQIGVNGGAMQNIELFQNGGAITIQEFIDQINNNDVLNQYISADFDDETGQVIIRAISADVESIEVGVAGSAQTANWGFGLNADLTGGAADEAESIRLAAAASTLATLEDDYNNIRDQIDQLVTNGDTGYRGTNLLNGDDLLTVFNEFRTSSLTTQGVTFTASGLGLDEGNFSRAATVDGALAQVREALEAVRGFGSTLANDLAIIQTRQTFTTELINTLKEGSSKLVDADQNEEGAKLLALQTRQSLGVTALSLASQSQQSILRLF